VGREGKGVRWGGEGKGWEGRRGEGSRGEGKVVSPMLETR